MPKGTLDVYRAAQDLAIDFVVKSRRRPTVTELRAHLAERLPEQPVPEERTLRRWITKARPPDPSGHWSLADADPEDARLILPILGARVAEGYRPDNAGGGALGHERSGPLMSNALAGWIVRLCRAVPGRWDLDMLEGIAMHYVYAESSAPERLPGLDEFVAKAAATYYLHGAHPWFLPNEEDEE